MDEEDRYTRITLRIPKDLHAVLTAEADRTSKSLNAQIVESLTRGIEDPARLEEMKDSLLKHQITARLARDAVDDARTQIARLEMREKARIDSERISRLIMRLITQGFRALLKNPSPTMLANADVALGRALLQKIDAGGVGVAAMLADAAPEDPSLRQLLKSIAVEESEMNAPPSVAPASAAIPPAKSQRAKAKPKS